MTHITNTPTTEPTSDLTDADQQATTIILIDPSSPDGEAALDALDESDRTVALVVLLTGRASSALREYALGEGIHLTTAGWNYLEQLTPRVAAGARQIEHVVAVGPDPAYELATIAMPRTVDRVVLPPSALRLDPTLIERLERLTATPVQVAALATQSR